MVDDVKFQATTGFQESIKVVRVIAQERRTLLLTFS